VDLHFLLGVLPNEVTNQFEKDLAELPAMSRIVARAAMGNLVKNNKRLSTPRWKLQAIFIAACRGQLSLLGQNNLKAPFSVFPDKPFVSFDPFAERPNIQH
jgi:hypothetical protein